MTPLVIDASVGLKWFLPEVHSIVSRRLTLGNFELNVPSLFYVEVGNALWMKTRRSELTPADAETIFSELSALPLLRHPDAPLGATGLSIALQTQRSVYDCIYLALAIQLGTQVVTADARFWNSLSNTHWSTSICWIENVP